MKTCLICGELKQASCFNKQSSSKDGLCRYCKQCRKIKRKQYNDKVKQRKSENKKTLMQQYYDTHGQDWLDNGQSHSVSTYRKVLERCRGHMCQCCGISQWCGRQLRLQMHHIDGNHNNNCTSNILLLCPNCHSQTQNYCGKNKNKHIPDDQQFYNAIVQCGSVYQACIKIGIAVTGTNYARAKQIVESRSIH